MGKKILISIVITFGVVMAYVIMLAMQPAVSELTLQAEVTYNATANVSHYTGVSDPRQVIRFFPWFIWFVPGGIGITAIVMLLRSGETTQ